MPRPLHPTPREKSTRARALTRALVAGYATAATALLGAACRAAPAAFGPAPAAARAASDDFFGGLAARFVNVRRLPKFAAARGKLGKYALSPSKLVGDTGVWTSTGGSTRTLELEGRPSPSEYLFVPKAGAAAPDRPGESRHVIRLQQLGDGEYQWFTVVDHAVGRVRAGDFAAVVTAGLTALERPERDIRADLRTTLPRSSAALGRLFVLETARATPQPDGSSLVDLRVRVDANRIRPTMPAFAEYVDTYVHPARYRIMLTDGRGGTWLEARGSDGVLTFRWRTHAGRLLALDGTPRPMPDSLQMRVDASAKFLMFRVGVSEMVGELTAIRGAHERGWTVRFQRAPHWHFPLAVNHLISRTLDRPFEKGGMLFRIAVRDGEVGQSLIARRFDVAVQESAIVRWLGGLGGKAMDDFAGRAEVEENRFTAEALQALRADVAAALGGATSGAGGAP